jgi:hypothetical protein
VSYDYVKEKPNVFLEENQELFLRMRDNILKMLNSTGAFQTSFALTESGDTFLMLAVVDRLEEIHDIKLVYSDKSIQRNVYTRGIK